MQSWSGHNVDALYTYSKGVIIPGRHWRPSPPVQRPGQRQQCWHGYHASAAFLQPADTTQPHLLRYTMHVTCFVFGLDVNSQTLGMYKQQLATDGSFQTPMHSSQLGGHMYTVQHPL